MRLLGRNVTPYIGLESGAASAGGPPARPLLDALRSDLAALIDAPRRYARAVRAALTVTRQRPLTLELPERTVTFNGLAEFEFALESRTEFPVGKIGDLLKRPAIELERAATNIRQVEKRFAEVLTQSLADPTSVGELMRDLEIKLFSQDHGWRDIVEAINRHPPAFDGYKRITLVKYMQYLASRQNVIRSIYMRGIGEHGERAEVAVGAAGGAARGSAEPAAPPRDDSPALQRDETQIVGTRDTAIFDVAQLTPAAERGPELHALPRGETVSVHVAPGAAIALRLANHRFELHAGARFTLVDAGGASYVLDHGRNVVGRQAECDVVIDASYRAVSRKHLVVEPVSDSAVLLTDISSHGTSVPQDAMQASTSSSWWESS